jgi:phospholipid/cholesterol/gamma-HCH transport system substrate-binding protein
MIQYSLMEKFVGLFILLSFLAFLAVMIIVGRGQHWFRVHHTYYAVYKEGYNLAPGTKVKLVKTNIGHVSSVTLTQDNQVKVVMKILAEYSSRIRTDSKAGIASPTFIGSEFINIIPGSPDAEELPPGSEIPSVEAKKISEYLEEFDFEHKMLMLDEILESINYILAELRQPESPLFGSLANLERLTAAAAQGEGTVGKLVHDRELYDRLLVVVDQINGVVSRLDQVMVSARTSVDAVKPVIHSLQTTVDNTRTITGDVKTKVPDYLNDVDVLLKKLNETSALLKKTMTDVPQIPGEARQALRKVDDILDSVKKNILIRGNLPAALHPESHGVEVRGD